MLKKAKNWLSNNSDFIQVLTTIVQTFIAALMLVTLIQSAAILSITQRQLESSIEPVLEMSMYGSTLRITNDGSIDIRKVERVAIITAHFDFSSQKISAYQVTHTLLPVADAIKPGATVDFDLTQILPPVISEEQTDSVIRVYCLVLKYRRAADMKQFTKLVPFIAGKDLAAQSTDIYMPLFPQSGKSEAMTRSGDPDYIYNANQELLRLYQTKVAIPDF